LTTEKNPQNCEFVRNGQKISMSQYFFDEYKRKLDPKQPLQFVNKSTEDRIYLPT